MFSLCFRAQTLCGVSILCTLNLQISTKLPHTIELFFTSNSSSGWALVVSHTNFILCLVSFRCILDVGVEVRTKSFLLVRRGPNSFRYATRC